MKRLILAGWLAVMLGGAGMLLAQSQPNPSTIMHTVTRQLGGSTPAGNAGSPPAQASAAAAQSQAPAVSQPAISLGTLARELRKERNAKGLKAVKLYTNGNIPHATEMTPRSSSAAGAKSSSAGNGSKAAAANGGNHGEAYFRSRMDSLRAKLALDERQLSVLQQQLGQQRLENSGNPQQELMQQSSPEFYSNQRKIQEKIAKKQSAIAADHQAMDNLTQQLREEGGQPGWIR